MNNETLKFISNNMNVSPDEIRCYPKSKKCFSAYEIELININGQRYLLLSGNQFDQIDFKGDYITDNLLLCQANHKNRLILNKIFPWTAPKCFGRKQTTMGLGDRLGLAGPGQIKAIENSNVKPILAQQSLRELNLTNRTYPEVLDAAAYAVFQEGYEGGFGADGDHLKKSDDIAKAIEDGYSMITLDCSDVIPIEIDNLNDQELMSKFETLPESLKLEYRDRYLKHTFRVADCKNNNLTIEFSPEQLAYSVLLYHGTIDFAEKIYKEQIEPHERSIDFELSIDETLCVTSPQDHFFVANELELRKVNLTSLAPRFVGEFQKGVDYIGNLSELDNDIKFHSAISDYFGYKLSIHSGSDKFSTFPLIGLNTNHRLHIKTAGTNWLEAVRVISIYSPDLYRRIHKVALDTFSDATAYYHVTTNLDNIRPLNQVSDCDLPNYLEQNDSRQLLHITYGYILADMNLKRDIYHFLDQYEDEYIEDIKQHIEKHLRLLGLMLTEGT